MPACLTSRSMVCLFATPTRSPASRVWVESSSIPLRSERSTLWRLLARSSELCGRWCPSTPFMSSRACCVHVVTTDSSVVGGGCRYDGADIRRYDGTDVEPSSGDLPCRGPRAGMDVQEVVVWYR